MIFKLSIAEKFTSGISSDIYMFGVVVGADFSWLLYFIMLLRKGSILYSICDSLIRLF